MRGAAVRGAGAARELSVSCLAGSVLLVVHGLAKVFWSVRCPTQVAPEYEGGATTYVPARDLPYAGAVAAAVAAA
ncbi:hypothetical protein SY2F82_06400 [Streptomyces sp. Y2F8-2]|nr:hypothetical protein SY2F82_06400 [Streptomyces sp. Y2F8-2]